MKELLHKFDGITPMMVDYYMDHYAKGVTFVRSSAIRLGVTSE